MKKHFLKKETVCFY